MVLLRHLLGDALRRLRLRQGRTLREVSASARVSLGYLSEVERGQKEASSELLAAICSALGTPLSHVLREVSDNFALAELQSEPVFADVLEPAIEVDAPVHGVPAGNDGQDERVSVPSAADPAAGTARRNVAASVATMAPGQLRAGSGNSGQLASRHLTVPGASRLPLVSGGLETVREPVFDRVTRAAHEITNMVPV